MDQFSARMNMVDSQVRTSDVFDLALVRAFRSVARERFCAPARAELAYAEIEPEIAPGRRLMTPRDIGKLLQLADPRPGERVLAIAAPYAAAVLAEMGLQVTAQEGDGRVVAVVGQPLAEAGVAVHIAPLDTAVGSGWDLIVCEAAVPRAPQAWLDALKSPGGRLVVVERTGPVGKARLYVAGQNGATGREAFDASPPLLEELAPAPAFQF